jgi:hypothetical protein
MERTQVSNMAQTNFDVLPDGYGKVMFSIAAIFLAFHAPAWIPLWYNSRFERAIPVVKVKIPAVSTIGGSLQAMLMNFRKGC